MVSKLVKHERIDTSVKKLFLLHIFEWVHVVGGQDLCFRISIVEFRCGSFQAMGDMEEGVRLHC